MWKASHNFGAIALVFRIKHQTSQVSEATLAIGPNSFSLSVVYLIVQTCTGLQNTYMYMYTYMYHVHVTVYPTFISHMMPCQLTEFIPPRSIMHCTRTIHLSTSGWCIQHTTNTCRPTAQGYHKCTCTCICFMYKCTCMYTHVYVCVYIILYTCTCTVHAVAK